MTLLDVLIKLSEKHVKIQGGGYSDLLTFDQTSHLIRSKRKILVVEGRIIPQIITLSTGEEYELTEDMKWLPEEITDPYTTIEDLFIKYRTSKPDKHSSYAKSNFQAKAFNDLTMSELLFGEKRQTALYRLELTVMYLTSHGLRWENANHWYWQSPKYKELLIYRNWII